MAYIHNLSRSTITTDRAVERILNFIAEPKVDEEYLPLLLFLGNGTVGRMQALWNFCKTMQILELETTAAVWRLTKASHDTVHRCGLHAPVPKSTLDGFFSRVMFAEGFKPFQRDQHLREYMRWFADNNRVWLFPRTRISSVAEWKTTRAWRRFPRLPHKPLTEVWPFLHKEAAKDHLDILLVDSLVPKGIPEQWRQDICQDLFVAILTGEVEPDELRNEPYRHIRKIFRDHPFKYVGVSSMDAQIGDESGLRLHDVVPDDAEPERIDEMDDDLYEVFRQEIQRR